MSRINNPNQGNQNVFRRAEPESVETPRFVPVENEPPLYTDENGRPTYDNNQSWFGTMNDRRLYWATGGGAGYWGGVPQIETPIGTIGWGALRTPVRAMYDWSIGLDPDAREDPEWTKMKQDSSWVDSQVKLIEDNLGPTADFIKEDFGELALRNVVLNSVSLDDQTARLTFVIDSAEAKRRIMDYDNDSSIGTFMGTKVSSAIFNVMATDPLTTIPTVATMGVGATIGGTRILTHAARGLSLNGKLPWVMNAEKAAQTFIQTHQVGLNITQAAVAPVDGAMSAYAYHYGWNKDQSIIYKDPTQSPNYDESATDDVLLGTGIGILAGGLTYSMIGRNVGRAAALEALATAGSEVPTGEVLDFSVRYTAAQAKVQRNAQRIGLQQQDPILAILGNREELWRRGFRTAEDLEELAKTIDEVKPNAEELGSILAQKQIAEHNRAVQFRERTVRFMKTAKDDVDADGNPIPLTVTDTDGTKLLNLGPRREAFADSLQADAHKALKDKGMSDEGIAELEAWIRSRVGMDRVDLYRWALVSDPTANEIGTLQSFIRNNIKEEAAVQNRFRKRIGESTIDPETITRADLESTEDAILGELSRIVGKYNGTTNPAIAAIFQRYNKFNNLVSRVLINGFGWDKGHPGALVQKIRETIDYKLRDRILRDINKEAKAGRISAEEASDLTRMVETADYRNKLMRQRLTEGELGEQLGLFNSSVSPFTENPKLTNGLYPTRTRFKGEKDLDVLDDSRWHGGAHNDLPKKSRPVSTAPSETKYQKAQKALKDAVRERNIAVSRFQRLGILKEILKEGMKRANISDLQRAVRLGVFGDNIEIRVDRISITGPDGITKEKPRLSIKFKNETGDFGEGVVLDLEDMGRIFTPESISDARARKDYGSLVIDRNKLDDFFRESEESLTQVARNAATKETELGKIAKERRLGYGMRDDDFVFANANTLTRLMRKMDYAGIWRMMKWSMDNNITGLRTGRLWFNDTAANRGGAFSMILQLAHMVDSAHVTRGDFGTHPMRMNSIQELRNYNAVQAHRVVKVLRKYAKVGNPFRETDHDAVRRRIVQEINRNEEGLDRGPLIKLDEKQTELYDSVMEFMDTFQRDIDQVLSSNNQFYRTDRREILNLVLGQVNQSYMLANRTAFRNKAESSLRRLHDNQLNNFERQARSLVTMGDDVGELILGKVTSLWNIGRLERTDAAGRISMEINQAIAEAADANELRRLFRLEPNGTLPFELQRRGFGIDVLLRDITDGEAAGLRNIDDLMELLRRKQGNAPFNDYMQGRINSLIEDLDPLSNLYSRHTGGTPPVDPMKFTGMNTLRDPVMFILRHDEELKEFFHRNIADMVNEFAHGQGTRIRTQAAFSRTFGEQHPRQTIFQLLADARRDILAAADETGNEKLRLSVEKDLHHLEDYMAHALGFQLESNPRYGWVESAMRWNNNFLRVFYGPFWGLNTLLVEIPKAFLLGVNRNGFINAFIDLLKAVKSQSQIEDIGAVLEQYTRRFALGVDNEAEMGGVNPGRFFMGNASPLRNLQTVGQILTGKIVDPSGAARAAIENSAGRLGTGTARVIDAVNHVTEGVANFNTRFGGLQYFSAVARDMAVRSGKRKLVREIELIKRFTKDLNGTWKNSKGQLITIDNLPTYEERLAAFKELAAKHNLDWAFAVRLNHHGLLNLEDLDLLSRAFKNESVTGRRGFWASVDGDPIYDSQALRKFLDDQREMDRTTRMVLPPRNIRTIDDISPAMYRSGESLEDRIMMKLTGYLEEEANTAVASATAMSATPNADWFQRIVGLFSNYTRGVQQQNILRGANDSNMARILAMATPLLVLEALYQEGRRVIISKQQGPDTAEKTLADMEREWREQPEVMLWRVFSRIPFFGSSQQFLLNNVVDPFDMTLLPSTGDVQMVKPQYTPQQLAHSLIYEGADKIVSGENFMDKIIGPDMKTKDIVKERMTPTTSRRGVFMGNFTGFEFTPYRDMFTLMSELAETNPYINKQEKYFGIPTTPPWAKGEDKTYGLLYQYLPGFRLWQMQSAMRLMGWYPSEEDPRARTYRRMQERIKQLQ